MGSEAIDEVVERGIDFLGSVRPPATPGRLEGDLSADPPEFRIVANTVET